MSALVSKTSDSSSPSSANDTFKDTEFRQTGREGQQTSLLVWLNADMDESSEDFKSSLQRLRNIMVHVETYNNAKECVDFLREVKNETIFMIVSGSLGQQIIEEIQDIQQLKSLYVLCNNKEFHEKWTLNIPKVKGVHTTIESIFDAMRNDREICDCEMVPICLNDRDPLFMYTSLLKDTFLEIEEDDIHSINGLVEFCHLQNEIPKHEIDKLKLEYRDHSPIWWYTAPYFIYSLLNRGLRVMDTDIILKMGFFIRHLHNDIDKIYREQQLASNKNLKQSPFLVYRAQGMLRKNFEKMNQNNTGGLMSFNTFLSTSLNRDVSLKQCVRQAALQQHMETVVILFVLTVDPILCEQASIPYANVKDVGYYKDPDTEILFTTYTMFRIDRIEKMTEDKTDRLWEVHLTLLGNDNAKTNEFTSYFRKNLAKHIGWSRLGEIFLRLGEPAKAKHIYKILLRKSTIRREQANYYNQLGIVHDALNEYSKAFTSFEQSLEISKKDLASNHPDLATLYNNVGLVCRHVGEYSNALLFYQQALEIREKARPPNHPDFAQSYNNLGLVYRHIGEYSKALSFYEQALEIDKINLPANHPDLATTYHHIGLGYFHMSEYSKALPFYEKSLKIRKVILPPNHPDLAQSYNSIGLIHNMIGECSKALSSFEKAFQIKKLILPANDPQLASIQNSIGLVYYNMGKYLKALSYFAQALEINKVALQPNHPEMAITYNNIALIYRHIGKYAKALLFYEKSFEIRKIALPTNHPDFARSYINIGELYDRMGEYAKALLYYEKAHEIEKKTLPSHHPYLAQSRKLIEDIKKKM